MNTPVLPFTVIRGGRRLRRPRPDDPASLVAKLRRLNRVHPDAVAAIEAVTEDYLRDVAEGRTARH